MNNTETFDIAIIGLAGRFPEAANLDSFWEMLKNGREAVVKFSDEELLAAGVDPELLQQPNYVKLGTVIPETEYFDATFFDMTAKDAEVTDPQQRLFMECVWQALEQAGYPPATTDARIGLYAGVGDNSYLQRYLEPNMQELLATVGAYRVFTLSGKDFIATRTAYKLNLTGPAMSIQTACSTSLVAVHVACQSLLNMECDMALAGGVSIYFPQKCGYLYQEGMIVSPDGHCRTFDAQAQGTAAGRGVGVVMLKRLGDALADGDTIHAVIKGSAVNNDGADKIGYTAPSVKGQTEVILEAQAVAGVHPDEISYIEAHGTATPLGDPIEIQALTQAFRANTQRSGYCAIGSVKTNIGHADNAAGIAGLIKTVLALKHRQLPPSLHFKTPNPQIDFAHSPFFVNNQLRDWETTQNVPRCAGVSSFGIGGTNAHVILAEAPTIEPSGSSRPLQLMTLSAKTATALEAITRNLATWLASQENLSLPDVCYTLNRGRQSFAYRKTLVCTDTHDAVQQLSNLMALSSFQVSEKVSGVAFLFPGQGSQYLGMTKGLYQTEILFKEKFDLCADLLKPHLGYDIRDLLYDDNEQNHTQLKQTAITQPILFVVEYALAKLWMAFGIQPQAMLGHSVGEYVAACLAGVFSLEEALILVANRGRLMQSQPEGVMLAVTLSESEAMAWCSSEISLAVVNGKQRCVLAGLPTAMAELQIRLKEQGIESKHLHTSHAFHSHLLEPMLESFAKYLQVIDFKTPQMPYLSNLTGTWITDSQATSPDYWLKHLRHTVRFEANLANLFQHDITILLEVGPGFVLSALAKQYPTFPEKGIVLPSLPAQRETYHSLENQQLLSTLGQLWQQGIAIDWQIFYQDEQRHRLPLPTYPFERKRYWIDLPQQRASKPSSIVKKNITVDIAPVKVIQGLTALEQQIATLWKQSIGNLQFDNDADFFALGGDSLLATQLIARLREYFKVELDTHSLLQAPTIAKLACLIAAQLNDNDEVKAETPLPKLLVKIQEGDKTRPPLILLYPVGGHVYFYRDLALHLDPKQPVYGIRAQGAEGEAPLLTTVEAMAEVCIENLKEFQPQGPYYLGGSSFGGTLAYEMAQKLVAQGETVAFLGLIDTPGTGHMPADLGDNADILFYLLKVGENVDLSLAELKALDEEQQLGRFLQMSQQEDTPAARAELRLGLTMFQTNMQAMLDYTPTAYQGKVYFYLAQERDEFNAQTPASAWIPLAKEGIEIYTVPGNHISMNTVPLVTHLAKCLGNNLNQNLRNYSN